MSQAHKVFSTEVITCHYSDDEDAQAVLIIYSDGAVDVRCAMRASCDPCKYEYTGSLLEREYLCESTTWCFGCRQPIRKGDPAATMKDKGHRTLHYHKACWDKKFERAERSPKRKGSENVQGILGAEVKGDSGSPAAGSQEPVKEAMKETLYCPKPECGGRLRKKGRLYKAEGFTQKYECVKCRKSTIRPVGEHALIQPEPAGAISEVRAERPPGELSQAL